MSIWALYELSEVKRYGRIYEGVIVLQGGVSLPNLKEYSRKVGRHAENRQAMAEPI